MKTICLVLTLMKKCGKKKESQIDLNHIFIIKPSNHQELPSYHSEIENIDEKINQNKLRYKINNNLHKSNIPDTTKTDVNTYKVTKQKEVIDNVMIRLFQKNDSLFNRLNTIVCTSNAQSIDINGSLLSQYKENSLSDSSKNNTNFKKMISSKVKTISLKKVDYK